MKKNQNESIKEEVLEELAKEEPIIVAPNVESNEKKPSSLIGVLLTMALIAGLMTGGLYYLNQFQNKKYNDINKTPIPEIKKETKDENKKSTENEWSGIYKKDNTNHRLLFFSEDGKIGSLIFAEEVDMGGLKGTTYPIQYENGMILEDGKMVRKELEQTEFEIVKDKNKIIIEYKGKEEDKEKYIELIGTYTKVRNVATFDVEELDD